MSVDFDIAVVGGGPVAASMALGLSSEGLRVALLGGSSASSAALPEAIDSRVYALTKNSGAWLRKTSLWQGLADERIAPIKQMFVSDSSGAPLRFASDDQLASMLEHSALVHASATALKFSKVTVLHDEASSVTIHSDHACVTSRTGQAVNAKLVIGADGANSFVRSSLGIPVTQRPYPHAAVVANLWIDDERLEAHTAFQWFGKDDILALLPLPNASNKGRMFNLVWSCPVAIAESFPENAQALIPALAQSLSRVDPVIASIVGKAQVQGKVQVVPLKLQKAQSLFADRVCLIGDAAHVIHPLAGQGMNLGFGDAQALFDVITQRERLRDLADPILLRRYARKRTLAIGLMQHTTDTLASLFAETNSPVQKGLARVIHWGWQRLDTLEPIKRHLIAQADR